MKKNWRRMAAGILAAAAMLSAGAFSAFASCHGYAHHDSVNCPRCTSYDCAYADADNDGICDYHSDNSCRESVSVWEAPHTPQGGLSK